MEIFVTNGNWSFTLSFVLLIHVWQFWVVWRRQAAGIQINIFGLIHIHKNLKCPDMRKKSLKTNNPKEFVNNKGIPFWSNVDNQKNLPLEFAKINILSINILPKNQNPYMRNKTQYPCLPLKIVSSKLQ